VGKKDKAGENPLKGDGELKKKKGALDDPSKGDKFSNEENLGRLLIIEVEDTDNIATENGDADVIKATVYAITEGDGKTVLDEPVKYEDAFLFGRVIFSSLKSKVGKTVVGVMAQGEKQKGKNAPWIIKQADEKQKAKAQKVYDTL